MDSSRASGRPSRFPKETCEPRPRAETAGGEACQVMLCANPAETDVRSTGSSAVDPSDDTVRHGVHGEDLVDFVDAIDVRLEDGLKPRNRLRRLRSLCEPLCFGISPRRRELRPACTLSRDRADAPGA